jgi:hypothetical protein
LWLSRGGPAWLQGELLCRSVKPSNKVAEEVAAKKYFGALVTDDRQFDLVAGSRNEYRQGAKGKVEMAKGGGGVCRENTKDTKRAGIEPPSTPRGADGRGSHETARNEVRRGASTDDAASP